MQTQKEQIPPSAGEMTCKANGGHMVGSIKRKHYVQRTREAHAHDSSPEIIIY